MNRLLSRESRGEIHSEVHNQERSINPDLRDIVESVLFACSCNKNKWGSVLTCVEELAIDGGWISDKTDSTDSDDKCAG